MRGGLIFPAAFAMLWAVVRARVQSITIDEADTYLYFVSGRVFSQWTPAGNNHILNTMLIRLFTSIFGPSHLSVRAGALIGAAIFISAAWLLCTSLSRDWFVQWPVFICLVFDPYVFDFLVAARGYGLAMAFLLAAFAVAAYVHRARSEGRPASLTLACAVCSACLGLSFASHFSFAFVDFAALSGICFWACATSTRSERWRIVAASIVPGLIVTVFLSAFALLHWPPNELVDGARTLRETLHSVREASFYRPNPELVNPLLLPALGALKPWLPRLLVIAAVLQMIALLLWRPVQSKWLLAFDVVAVGALVGSLSLHWISFKAFHLLLPKDRNAVYIAPLFALAAGILAAIPPPSNLVRMTRRALLGVLFAISAYFLLCLRLSYFKEWEWGADVRKVYDVAAYYNHTYCVREIPVHWYYSSALNFYRSVSGHEDFAEFVFPPSHEYSKDRNVYILNSQIDSSFIEEQSLDVVYRGDSTDVVVAVKPGLQACRPAAH
jgi:hypothetical protein